MAIFRRNKTEDTEVREAGSGVIPPARSETVWSQDLALSVGAVYRSVQIISTMLAQLPMSVKRGDEEIPSSLAQRPDVNNQTNDFWGSTAASMALTGNAYWYVTRDQDGVVKNLEVLNPKDVIVTREDRVGAPYRFDVGGRRVPNKNIKHLRLTVLPGAVYGLGPLQAARGDIENAKKLQEYGNAFMGNGAIPTGVLSSDQYLNQEQANAYRAAWGEAQSTRGLAVLGAGLSYSPIALSPADLQFLENQQFSTLQIARLFGIPSVFLSVGMEGSSLTYATTESMAILFLQTTLSDYLVSVEQAFTDLLPRGQVGKFRLDSLMRADLATRVEAYSKLITQQVITPTEVRLLEGYGPEPEGEFFNNAPISAPQQPSV